ncbi:MAG TPA: hypothetical protein PKA30_05730 [Accumulibacter sp.]|uniref:hypothetical protein n=1 Tax=Accumulibacter sp. TaxID=2053492 RepID=UPI0028782B73|nr:hypothetical protein [Accumulibacter sp.]MDS4055237.1 hypothetical protein [Accumulibacter sp.]HMV05033.1 hypothetical protein [Accumulibacter sp.]HMW80008.1 hypothetical protein [Accumulibacter sp.]HNB68161.1 hypothetical protein [Accumulibacter sp.]HNE39601.1 hypothetical protein [Accumulibacter sp.]
MPCWKPSLAAIARHSAGDRRWPTLAVRPAKTIDAPALEADDFHFGQPGLGRQQALHEAGKLLHLGDAQTAQCAGAQGPRQVGGLDFDARQRQLDEQMLLLVDQHRGEQQQGENLRGEQQGGHPPPAAAPDRQFADDGIESRRHWAATVGGGRNRS